MTFRSRLKHSSTPPTRNWKTHGDKQKRFSGHRSGRVGLGGRQCGGAVLSPAEPADLREVAWLVDWKGKLLRTIYANSRKALRIWRRHAIS
jgi:hypothetical protein